MGPKNKGEAVKLVCMRFRGGRSTETWEVS